MTDRTELAELASTVSSARFPTARLKQGYALDQVDAFLVELSGLLNGGKPVGAVIDNALFKQRLGGYDMAAVDEFLDDVRAAAAEADGVATDGSDTSPSAAALGRRPSESGGLAVLHALLTIGIYGVLAGCVTMLIRRVRPETTITVVAAVVAGCVIGLLYEVGTRAMRARQQRSRPGR